jgi:hypothetical protein
MFACRILDGFDEIYLKGRMPGMSANTAIGLSIIRDDTEIRILFLGWSSPVESSIV